MKAPEGKAFIDDETATFWFDEDGILCCIAKAAPLTVLNQQERIRLIRQAANDKKVCYLTDITDIGPVGKVTQQYTANSQPGVYKAMAVISRSASGTTLYNSFVSSQGNPIPMKLFSNEHEAREWLKAYL